MFDMSNKFVNELLTDQKNFLLKNINLKNFDLFDRKNEIQLSAKDYYIYKVSNWFFRLNDNLAQLQDSDLLKKNVRFQKRNIYKSYISFLKYIKAIIIDISSYHDLLFHFLFQLNKMNIYDNNLTWEVIKPNLDDNTINIMNELYNKIKTEINFRNRALHDFDYSWMDKYIGSKAVTLCENHFFKQMESILLPYQKSLIKEMNLNAKKIQLLFIDKVNTLKSLTQKLFLIQYKNYKKYTS